jgi:NAD(P)H-flavin reductase
LPQRVFLFYSNRRPEDAASLADLQSLEKDNPKYKLIASMTEMEKSHQPWNGETGLITQEMLGKHLKGAASPIYYIAGPPAMMKGLRRQAYFFPLLSLPLFLLTSAERCSSEARVKS